MRLDVAESLDSSSADTIARLSEQLEHQARLVREQAAAIAHYKKMYDRSSALARIGVWECDLATDALTWTDGVYDLFELPRGSALDRSTIVLLYYEDSRVEMERLRAAAISDGTGFELDIHIRTARGNERWLRLTADVELEDGRAVRIFGTKQDISEEKAAQARLRALQSELIHVSRGSAMDAMAATLAHELNQPLTAISAYAAGMRRMLQRPASDEKAVESGLDEIERCALTAGDIIRSLRLLANGRPTLAPKVALNPLIREAATIALAGAGRAALGFALAEEVVVEAEPVQIQQVLINLIRNAVEAVDHSSRREILVSTAYDGEEVEIRIEDSGPGIDPILLDTLFESFVTSKPRGLGVGLSISRTIVEAHGGRISAANRDEGGACFLVVLPALRPD